MERCFFSLTWALVLARLPITKLLSLACAMTAYPFSIPHLLWHFARPARGAFVGEGELIAATHFATDMLRTGKVCCSANTACPPSARKLEVQVLDAWTIVMFSTWISQHFLWCADAGYAALPSKAERNSWKVAMDLDHVPWKSLCKTYGLTLEEIAPPRMNAEGQPVERLDVWLLKGSNQVRCSCLSL